MRSSADDAPADTADRAPPLAARSILAEVAASSAVSRTIDSPVVWPAFSLAFPVSPPPEVVLALYAKLVRSPPSLIDNAASLPASPTLLRFRRRRCCILLMRFCLASSCGRTVERGGVSSSACWAAAAAASPSAFALPPWAVIYFVARGMYVPVTSRDRPSHNRKKTGSKLSRRIKPKSPADAQQLTRQIGPN